MSDPEFRPRTRCGGGERDQTWNQIIQRYESRAGAAQKPEQKFGALAFELGTIARTPQEMIDILKNPTHEKFAGLSYAIDQLANAQIKGGNPLAVLNNIPGDKSPSQKMLAMLEANVADLGKVPDLGGGMKRGAELASDLLKAPLSHSLMSLTQASGEESYAMGLTQLANMQSGPPTGARRAVRTVDVTPPPPAPRIYVPCGGRVPE